MQTKEQIKQSKQIILIIKSENIAKGRNKDIGILMVDRQPNEFCDRTLEKFFLGSNCSDVNDSVSNGMYLLLFVLVTSRWAIDLVLQQLQYLPRLCLKSYETTSGGLAKL